MKNFRGTIIFAAIVAAIGFLALKEFKKSEVEKEEKPTLDQIYRGFQPEELESFEYASRFELKQTDGKWQITSPVQDDADVDDVTNFIRSLLTQNIEALDLDGGAVGTDAHKRYGLDMPQAQFNFKTKKGTNHKVVIGSVQTYDKGYYIKKDEAAEIWVGSNGWDSIINKSYNDLRNKKINLNTADLTQLNLKHNVDKSSQNISLHLKEGVWQLDKNSQIKIDAKAVSDFFESIKNLKADTIAFDNVDAKALAQAKLDKPNLTISLVFSEGVETKILFQIPKSGDASYTASANKAIYKISESKAREYLKDVQSFRDKAFLFNYTRDVAAQFELSRNSGVERLQFEKKNTDWALIKSTKSIEGQQVIQTDVNAFLTEIKDLKAEEFLPTSRQFKTVGAVIIKDDKGQKIFELNYGGLYKTKDSKELYVVKTSLSQEPVAVMKSTIENLFSKKLIEDVPKPEATAPAAAANGKAENTQQLETQPQGQQGK